MCAAKKIETSQNYAHAQTCTTKRKYCDEKVNLCNAKFSLNFSYHPNDSAPMAKLLPNQSANCYCVAHRLPSAATRTTHCVLDISIATRRFTVYFLTSSSKCYEKYMTAICKLLLSQPVIASLMLRKMHDSHSQTAAALTIVSYNQYMDTATLLQWQIPMLPDLQLVLCLYRVVQYSQGSARCTTTFTEQRSLYYDVHRVALTTIQQITSV